MQDLTTFIQNNNYDIDQIYIDAFWSSIEDDKWIYVNDELIKWMGYTSVSTIENKRNYLNVLKNNYIKNVNFKHLYTNDFKLYCDENDLNIDFDIENKTKHLIIEPETFKKSLLRLQSQKARQIQDYYILLEKIFKHYMKYQKEYIAQQAQLLQEENEKLKDTQVLLETIKINQQPIKYSSYIYISSNAYYEKQHLYKIGKSVNPIKRVENFNCTSKDKDNEFYLIFQYKTTNSTILEKYLFHMLQNFNYKGELFQIPINALKELVKFICEQDNENTNLVNHYIVNLQNDFLNNKIDKEEENYIKQHYNENADTIYNQLKEEFYLQDLANKDQFEKERQMKKEEAQLQKKRDEYVKLINKVANNISEDEETKEEENDEITEQELNDFANINDKVLDNIANGILASSIRDDKIAEKKKTKKIEKLKVKEAIVEFNTVSIFLDELIKTIKKNNTSDKLALSELITKYSIWHKKWFITNSKTYKDYKTYFHSGEFKNKLREYGLEVSDAVTKQTKFVKLPVYNNLKNADEVIDTFLDYLKHQYTCNQKCLNNEHLANCSVKNDISLYKTEKFFKNKKYNHLVPKTRLYEIYLQFCKQNNYFETVLETVFFKKIDKTKLPNVYGITIMQTEQELKRAVCVNISGF